MISPRHLPLASVVLALVLVLALPVARAGAEGFEGDDGASWHLEQPSPPEPPPDVSGSTVPIGLGRIGDIEFFAPNLGLLTTAGNPPTIPPGLWVYNGQGWHELSTVCGATDGRIAWAGADEFWTISDGRPGQASAEGRLPPLKDDTLCHFAGGQVVGSYASLAFQASSYQPMHAAACITSTDCWFGGAPLPEAARRFGSFQLHWNGGSLSPEPYPEEGHTVEDMRSFEGRLYESVRLSFGDLPPVAEPSTVHIINPEGAAQQFESVPFEEIPLYGFKEFPTALDFLHLSAGEGALWGAAGPQGEEPPEKSAPAGVTVVRDAGGVWSQVLGPRTTPSGESVFPNTVVKSIAAEPGTEEALLALEGQKEFNQDEHNLEEETRPNPTAHALVARISSTNGLPETQALPSSSEESEGIGPKGAADQLACPAPHDCWLITTRGWLFHLAPSNERKLPEDSDPAFTHLITFRPPDAGVPAVVPDNPPPDDSGLPGEQASSNGSQLGFFTSPPEPKAPVPLLSGIHARLVHGTTLELRFHLAVEARVQLVAKRHKKVVSKTPVRTLARGSRKLLLALNRHRWPTSIALNTHALAKLPTESLGGPGTNTVSTGLFVLPSTPLLLGSGPLG